MQKGRGERERDSERESERDVEVIIHIPPSKITPNYCHQVAESVYLWQGRWQIAAALFTQLTVAPCLFQQAENILHPSENSGSENIYIPVFPAYAPPSAANLCCDAISKGHPQPFQIVLSAPAQPLSHAAFLIS